MIYYGYNFLNMQKKTEIFRKMRSKKLARKADLAKISRDKFK